MRTHHQRTHRGAIAVAVAVVVSTLLPAQVAAASSGHTTWTERATASYQALQQYLYLGPSGHQMYLENYPKATGDNDYSYLWPAREATAATIDMSQLPKTGGSYANDVQDRFTTLGNYWDASRGAYDSYAPAPLGAGGDPFYDDNAIVGIEQMRQYRIAHTASLLDDARRTFRFIETGWDTDASRPYPGGLHWVDASWNNIKATNATSLAAEFATHLYEETGDRAYLDWATRAYTWVRDYMRSPEGLYYNDVAFDGTRNDTLWIYNSGSMIGAATLLYRATGEQKYLQMAQADAAAAIAYWTKDDRYYQQPAIFNAIFFKNLLLLASVDHNPSYRRVIEHYANLIWDRNREAATGLFRFQASGGGAPDPNVRAQTLEQSAAVQIFAVLGWKSKDYRNIA